MNGGLIDIQERADFNLTMDRFWAQVVKGDRCWLWQGSMAAGKTGAFHVGCKRVLAHRLVWELYHGPIPNDMTVRRACKVKRCLAPAHLYLDPWPASTREQLIERFWRRVEKTEGCWYWRGALDRPGYGMTGFGGTGNKAHRFSYELHYGPIPNGLLVCHKCDNPPCVNPEHLFVGTNADNIADMIAKGRAAIRKGELHHKAKLKDADVLSIRERYSQGGMPERGLATIYGVSSSTIDDIVHYRRWKHI